MSGFQQQAIDKEEVITLNTVFTGSAGTHLLLTYFTKFDLTLLGNSSPANPAVMYSAEYKLIDQFM